MSTSAAASGWAIRVHAAFDWVLWVVTVNALWYLFTLAGGVVLGAAPASVAAAELTRRRLRGEAFPALRSFAAAWRREFWRANAAVGPVLLVLALLGFSLVAQTRAGTAGTPFGLATAGAFVVAFAVVAVVVPLYAHYDLPLRAYAVTAGRWMLRSIPHVVVLLLAVVVVVAAGVIVPGIIPFVSLGAWLVIDTALCLGFFAANDRRLSEINPPQEMNEGVRS